MGESELVTSIEKLVKIIKEKEGKINVFMLLLDEDNSSTYTVVISSKWLDNLSPYEGTKLVVDYLFSNLQSGELSLISRVTVVSTKDPAINSINICFSVSGGTAIIEDCQFNNVIIPHCLLFESQN